MTEDPPTSNEDTTPLPLRANRPTTNTEENASPLCGTSQLILLNESGDRPPLPPRPTKLVVWKDEVTETDSYSDLFETTQETANTEENACGTTQLILTTESEDRPPLPPRPTKRIVWKDNIPQIDEDTETDSDSTLFDSDQEIANTEEYASLLCGTTQRFLRAESGDRPPLPPRPTKLVVCEDNIPQVDEDTETDSDLFETNHETANTEENACGTTQLILTTESEDRPPLPPRPTKRIVWKDNIPQANEDAETDSDSALFDSEQEIANTKENASLLCGTTQCILPAESGDRPPKLVVWKDIPPQVDDDTVTDSYYALFKTSEETSNMEENASLLCGTTQCILTTESRDRPPLLSKPTKLVVSEDNIPQVDEDTETDSDSDLFETNEEQSETTYTDEEKFNYLESMDIVQDKDINSQNFEMLLLLNIKQDNEANLQDLVLRGLTDINCLLKDRNDQTPLHVAVVENSINCLKVLLVSGALVGRPEKKRGDTALHLAAQYDHVECAVCLIEFGANVEANNNDNWTPLHVAAFYGQRACLQILLTKDANVEARTKTNGNTPLHLASQENRYECVHLLLEIGADVEARNKTFGRTSLHLAAIEGHIESIRYLIEYGADESSKDQAHMTALKIAELYGHEICIEEFKNKTPGQKDTIRHGLPKEIRVMSSESADKLKDMMKYGWYRSYDARYMIVGEFGVGKTTIARLLVGEKLILMRQSTNGIELYIGRAGINIEDQTWCCHDETLSLEDIIYQRMLMYAGPTQSTNTTFQRQFSQRTETMRRTMRSTSSVERMPNKPTSETSLVDVISPWKLDKIAECNEQPRKLFEMFTRRTTIASGDVIQIKVDKHRLLRQTVKACKRMLHKVNKAPVYIWDFGGQDVFYVTHHTFLTYRGIYIIIIDGSRGLDEPSLSNEYIPGRQGRLTTRGYLMFWVNSILTYSKHSANGFPKIIVLATHMDKLPEHKRNDWKKTIFKDIEKMFENHEASKHLVLQHEFFVDARNMPERQISELQNALVEIAISQPFWGEKMPKRFLHLEMELLLSTKQGSNIMSRKELKMINQNNPIEPLSDDELQMFLHLQHSIGRIIYFPIPKLDEYIILNPVFLIDAFRSIITDITFCENDNLLVSMWKNMNETGVLSKKSIDLLWSKKGNSQFDKYKAFLIEVMQHLDFIAEPRMYEDGKLLQSEIYLVPCMLSARPLTCWPPKQFDERAVVISFVFQRSFLPPAISFRFLTACLSIWTVVRDGEQSLLSSGFLVVAIDQSHQLSVRCDEKRIVVSLVHSKSKYLIANGLAASLLESLYDMLENICDVYRSSIDNSLDEQRNNIFEVEVGCTSQSPCFIPKTAVMNEKDIWTCPEHQVSHRLSTILMWFENKERGKTCAEACPGVEDNDEFLNLSLDDDHLCVFSNQLTIKEVDEVLIQLGMNYKKLTDLHHSSYSDEIVKVYSLLYWKEKTSKIVMRDLKTILKDMKLDPHILCKVTKTKSFERKISSSMQTKIPTDQDLDKAAYYIGIKSLHVAISLGLSLTDWDNLRHQHPKNLPQLNRSILVFWMKQKSKAKPTLEMLANAVSMADKNPSFLFE